MASPTGTPRVAVVRRATLVLAVLAGFFLLVDKVGRSAAAFSGSTANPTNAFTADTLDPTGSFSASRPCTVLGPAYRASTTKTTLGGSSMALTTPTTAVGDYLIMSVMSYNNSGAAVTTITTPAGWTALGGNLANGADYDVRSAVFGLATPASPAASYTVSLSGVSVAAAALTSYSGITGVDTSTTGTGTAATAVAPTRTAATTNELLVAVYAHSGTASTTPTGMTASVSVNGVGAGLHQYHEVRAASGATGTRSSTINATNPAWVAASVLLTGSGAGYDPTIDLSWTVTPDTWATGYEIIRASGPTTSVSGQSTVTWSDTTTSSATAYTYTITAAYSGWRSTTRTVNVTAC
jgi:hypothetical protein